MNRNSKAPDGEKMDRRRSRLGSFHGPAADGMSGPHGTVHGRSLNLCTFRHLFSKSPSATTRCPLRTGEDSILRLLAGPLPVSGWDQYRSGSKSANDGLLRTQCSERSTTSWPRAQCHAERVRRRAILRRRHQCAGQ